VLLSDPTGAGLRGWEALEVCSCDLVPPGAPGHAYNEAAFRYLLAFEQKRARRLRTSFLLVLVRPKRNGSPAVRIDASVATTIFSCVSRCLRDGDFIGWYREARVIGAVLAQGATPPAPDLPGNIGERLTAALAHALQGDVGMELQVRVLQLLSRDNQKR
jgi:hypothetical protein